MVEDGAQGAEEVGVEVRRLRQQVDEWQRKYEELSVRQETTERTLRKLRAALGGTIRSMALTVEIRDPYAAGHQRRVADLARAIATEMHLSEAEVDGIRMAGAIHDVGKIAVPVEILSKPSVITDLERNLIRIHPLVGYDILKSIEFPWPVAEIVLQHHERLDGSGYPRGLTGEAMLLEAKVVAVADVIEAMTADRPHREAKSLIGALEEVRTHRGVWYDSAAVDACETVIRNEGYRFDRRE